MATPKSNSKPKAASRKSVVQAIATQDKENKKEVSKNSADIQEAIRLKAYEIYVERGGTHGNHEEDWAAAEKMVLKASR